MASGRVSSKATSSSLAKSKPVVSVTSAKADTIIDWVWEAGQHAEAMKEVLLGEYRLSRGQIDGLWAYAGNKEEKRLSRD
jgi:hypothetical protein